jgi:hypothetical protein
LDVSVFLGLTQSVDRIFFTALNQWNPSTILDVIMINLSLYGREVVWVDSSSHSSSSETRDKKKVGLILLILFTVLTTARAEEEGYRES